MLSHLSLGVRDLARSTAFYDAIMTALGYARVYTAPDAVGYGARGTDNDKLLLIQKPMPPAQPAPGFHLAFIAPNREAVHRFHENALQLGGVDQGVPGLRPHYGSDYYAAFVLDLDGHKLEAKYSALT